MSGLAAANLAVQRLGQGRLAEILPGANVGRTVCAAHMLHAVAQHLCSGVRAAVPYMVRDALPHGLQLQAFAACLYRAVEPDEPHITAAREANKALKSLIYNSGIKSPFL